MILTVVHRMVNMQYPPVTTRGIKTLAFRAAEPDRHVIFSNDAKTRTIPHMLLGHLGRLPFDLVFSEFVVPVPSKIGNLCCCCCSRYRLLHHFATLSSSISIIFNYCRYFLLWFAISGKRFVTVL